MAKKKQTRSERFSSAMGLAEDARIQVEELKDELDEWLSNMPENLQGGSKAEEIEEAISALEEVIDCLDQAQGSDVMFPRAF